LGTRRIRDFETCGVSRVEAAASAAKGSWKGTASAVPLSAKKDAGFRGPVNARTAVEERRFSAAQAGGKQQGL